jgi:hypothetical protein
MEDPLDFVDFADIIQHGDQAQMEVQGTQAGQPNTSYVAARSIGNDETL